VLIGAQPEGELTAGKTQARGRKISLIIDVCMANMLDLAANEARHDSYTLLGFQRTNRRNRCVASLDDGQNARTLIAKQSRGCMHNEEKQQILDS
jgi:hypothetical protein